MSDTLTTQIVDIPLDRIHAGDNDRTVFDPVKLRELADSIVLNGLHQPITVRPDGDKFRIVMGERRFRAHQLLDAPTIRAMIRPDLDDEAESMAMLIENVQRDDLNPIDEAKAYRDRMMQLGISDEELAARIGVKVNRIRWRVDLLRLDADIQELTASGQMSVDRAWELTRLDSQYQRVAMRAFATRPGMSFKSFNLLCADLLRRQQESPMFDVGIFMQVEEIAADAERRTYGIRELKDLVRRMAEALEGTERADLLAEAKLVAA